MRFQEFLLFHVRLQLITITSKQEMDSDLKIILNSKSLKVEKCTVSGSLTKMYCYRQKVFQQFHRLSQPGVRSTVDFD